MKLKRIEELAARSPDAMCEEASDAELLHLLRCARAVAEMEVHLRRQGGQSAFTQYHAGLCEIGVSLHDAHGQSYGPDLLTAIEAALRGANGDVS